MFKTIKNHDRELSQEPNDIKSSIFEKKKMGVTLDSLSTTGFFLAFYKDLLQIKIGYP